MNIDDLKERQKMTMAHMDYSLKRIDLLVISISGASIYVCLEALKFLREQDIPITSHIHISGGLFLLAILINFISQFLGFKANKLDYEWSCMKVHYKSKSKENRKKTEKVNINAKDELSDKYNLWTTISNITSAAAMVIGLILLLYYFAFIF